MSIDEERESAALLERLALWPEGYCEGFFDGRRWGATLTRSADGARLTLFARDLAGGDIVSANFYRLGAGVAARPCEMPFAKVSAFVKGFSADPGAAQSGVRHRSPGNRA